MDLLNGFGNDRVFLKSSIDVSANPSWLLGVKPNADGKTESAISCVVIVTDHGDGILDAFCVYFYAYSWCLSVSILLLYRLTHSDLGPA